MNIQKIDTSISGEPSYQVDFSITEIDLFMDWFAHIEERVSVKINGQLYRFRTEQEKACFEYGLSHFYRENEKTHSLLSDLKSTIKQSDDRIKGLIETLKKPISSIFNNGASA